MTETNVTTTTEAPALRRCRWSFDGERVYRGYTDGSTWNGFDNVWVTAETHAQVLADSGEPGPNEDRETTLHGMTAADCVDAETVDGRVALYCYGWGYTSSLHPALEMWATFQPWEDANGETHEHPEQWVCGECRDAHPEYQGAEFRRVSDDDVESYDVDFTPCSGPLHCGECDRSAISGEPVARWSDTQGPVRENTTYTRGDVAEIISDELVAMIEAGDWGQPGNFYGRVFYAPDRASGVLELETNGGRFRVTVERL